MVTKTILVISIQPPENEEEDEEQKDEKKMKMKNNKRVESPKLLHTGPDTE
jgi:hypothetical protein